MHLTSWRSGLKQQRAVLGGLVLVMSLTACSAANPSQATQPTPTPAPANASPPASPVAQSPDAATASQQEAVQVIRDYYRAINRRDYQQAYAAWGDDGVASQQSFEEFQRGFAGTSSVAVEVGEPGDIEGAAGSLYIEIPVMVTAVTVNGTPQRFRGSYTLRRVNDVPGSTPEQRQWHFSSSNISQVN